FYIRSVLDFFDATYFEILRADFFHLRVAFVVKALAFARRGFAQRVGGDERQRNRRVHVADDAIGQGVGINFSPAPGFGGRRAAQAAGVGARVGALQKIVVPALLDAHDFLNLRLGLQNEILRRAAAEDEDATR